MTRYAGLALVAALAASAPAPAAGPRDELLRLVGDDASFCFLMQDFRRHAGHLGGSPFAAQFARHPLLKGLAAAPEFKSLGKVEEQFLKHLGLDAAKVVDDWIGDAVVFVYRHPPPDKPDQDQGVILTWLRKPDEAAKVIERLDELQRASGELKELRAVEYNGGRYTHRVKKPKDEFVYLRGNVLAFSSDEAMVRGLIDLDRQAPAVEKSAPLVTRSLRDLGVDSGALVWWVNPRRFDADLKGKAAAAQGAEAAFLTNFVRYWGALDGVALYLGLDRHAEAGVAVRARTASLPAAAQRWLREAEQPSALWRYFPEDAAFAVAGRLDLAALLDVVGEFLTPQANKKLRDSLTLSLQTVNQSIGPPLTGDILAIVLGSIGPDWGVCVGAPPASEKGWFPQAVAAVRVAPGRNGVAFRSALTSALNVFSATALLAYNMNHPEAQIRPETVKHGGGELRVLVGEKVFPAGCRPCFGLKDGYLVFGSSPESVRRYFPAEPPAPPAPPNGEVPLLRMSFGEAVAYLKGPHREAMTDYFATAEQVDRDEARRRVDGLIAGLELFDRVELVQRSDGGRATLALRVRTAQALKR